MSSIKEWLQNMDKVSREPKKRDLDFLNNSDKDSDKESKENSTNSLVHKRRRRVNQSAVEMVPPENTAKPIAYDVPENVYKAYYTIQKIIESADLCIQDIYRVPEEERATRVVVDQMRFDGILQGLLLHVALADGNFTLEQQLFIERIVQRGNLLKLMKAQTNNRIDLTMPQVAAMTYEEQRGFLNEMDEWVIRELSGRAIVLLVAFEYGNSLSDQGTMMNYLSWIHQCINEIAGFVMQLKGKMSFEEKYEIEEAVNQLLRNPWLEARESYLS